MPFATDEEPQSAHAVVVRVAGHPSGAGRLGVRRWTRSAVAAAAMLATLGCAAPPWVAAPGPLPPARLDGDGRAALQYRAGLRDVVAYVAARPDLFPPRREEAPPLPDAPARAEVRSVWARFLDYLLALDGIARYYQHVEEADGAARARALLIGHAVFVAEYRFALDLLDRLDRAPALHVVLNEPVPELGLPRGSYARMRFRFLNVLRATEFVAWDLLLEEGGAEAADLRAAIAEDRSAIWRAGRGRGPAMTAANAVRVVQRAGAAAWFPVQAGVAEWMGDTRVGRPRPPLISPSQIAALAERLEPGDILLQRREWYLSNIGLPGFWPHAALYVGSAADRARLAQDPAVQAWAREQGGASGDLDGLLRARFPAAYARHLRAEDGRPRRVLEALSDGVVFTSLEHSAAADALAVLRPRLPAVERAAALLRAFGYAGRPYDYHFDFRSDAALVCTEVVYKAYEPAVGRRGLSLAVPVILGRPVLPANELARQFHETVGSDAQPFDLVLFLDGHERTGAAAEESLDEFRRSWRRPKWRLAPEP